MNKKRTAAPVYQTESGSGQVFFKEVDPSEDDHITCYQPMQGTIAALLLRGHEHALTTKELARVSGLHPRKVTNAIMEERRHGAPILSSGDGFWLAENAEEVRMCVRKLHCRAGEIHKTAQALAATAKATKEGGPWS